MYLTKTYSAFGEDLIISIDISNKIKSRIVYMEYINSLIEFLIRHIRPSEIYNNKKFTDFISSIGNYADFGITITLVTDDHKMDNTEIVCQNIPI